MTFDEYLAVRRARVDAALDRLLPAADAKPTTIHAAMRHSVFAGGKRIRPVLAIAAGEALGTELGAELPGCAVECIHTYSLIHDDLPALDNDDLRRGKPTCHKVYGEAMAILAGVGLLTVAFKILAELDAPADTMARLLRAMIRSEKGLYWVDWSAIEGRVAPWLANSPTADDKLDLYREGRDLYA